MNILRRTLPILLSFLLTVLPLPLSASAVGILEGTILDESGAPLPGVSVEVRGPSLVSPRTFVTDVNGHFRFPPLPAGEYEVTAMLAGFATKQQRVQLSEKGLSLKLTMAIASVACEVTVTAEAPVVDSLHTSTGRTAADDKEQKLPEARNYAKAFKDKKPGSEVDRKNEETRASGAQSFDNQYPVDALTTPGRPAPTTAAPVPQPSPALGFAFSPLPVLKPGPYPDMFFKNFGVNPTVETEEEPVSTFSVDVDTASYSLARSYLNRGVMPDPDSVRVEEFVNSFDYRYEPPTDGSPFSLHAEAFPSPNRKGYHVLHLGLKGREVSQTDRKPATLVFCIDVSGSMGIENRLGLVKRALRLLVNELDERDRVGIVVYGTNARVLLEPITAEQKPQVLAAIEELRPEGSTNAQAGIREAYKMAARHLRPRQTNRIVLCSDGVANNGVTDADAIFAEVKKEADRGITITTVGFGMGNYNDILMERLAHIGNGNYAYVDRLEEARRLFVTQLSGTLQVIAKDVKIQMAFDPESVVRYRLLGFEKRALSNEDFANDRVDAGEVGAGHSVTALYEVKLRPGAASLGSLRIRYKDPDGHRSNMVVKSLSRSILKGSAATASTPARLSFITASFAEKLRGSYWVRNLSYEDLLSSCDRLNEKTQHSTEVAELRSLMVRARDLDSRGDRFEGMVPVADMDFDRVPVLK
jgi:Ca-activated chloride channel family protein